MLFRSTDPGEPKISKTILDGVSGISITEGKTLGGTFLKDTVIPLELSQASVTKTQVTALADDDFDLKLEMPAVKSNDLSKELNVIVEKFLRILAIGMEELGSPGFFEKSKEQKVEEYLGYFAECFNRLMGDISNTFKKLK